jgi:hypothetical protein
MDKDIYPHLNWARKLTAARTTYLTEMVEGKFEHDRFLQEFGQRYVFVLYRFGCCMYHVYDGA